MPKTNSRLRLLIENFFAYGLINVLNKIIPLLLLPVITRLLTDPADFGRFDMFNTLVSFGSALAGLGMYDAMFREYFEKDNSIYKKKVTSNALLIVSVSSMIIGGFLIVLQKYFSLIFLGSKDYGILVLFAALGIIFSSLKSIIAAPTRIQNKRSVYMYSGILNSIFYYVLAIILIYLGLTYLALIYASLFASISIFIFFYILNHSHFTIKLSDKKVRSELFKIGVPLVPTFIIYWIFHSMDKIMITNMLGLDQVGIYSVGARVASISQFLYVAFSGGWQYFAFSTMKDDDYKIMMGKIWEGLLVLSTCFFVLAFLFKDLAFEILFVGDYRKGIIVFPYLLYAPFLQMLYQILGTQLQVIKKTYFSPMILSSGALVNLILNYLLIPALGIKGAAIATFAGFFTVVIIALIIIVGIHKLLKFSKLTISIGLFTLIILLQFMFGNSQIISLVLGFLYILFSLVMFKDKFKSRKSKDKESL